MQTLGDVAYQTVPQEMHFQWPQSLPMSHNHVCHFSWISFPSPKMFSNWKLNFRA
jgi:hypothetical protein